MTDVVVDATQRPFLQRSRNDELRHCFVARGDFSVQHASLPAKVVVALQHGRVSGRAASAVVGLRAVAELRHPGTDERVVVLGASEVLRAVLGDVLAFQVLKSIGGHAVRLYDGAVDAAADGVDGVRCDLLLLGLRQFGIVRQPAQGVGVNVVDPGLILEGELESGKGGQPAMTSGVELGGSEDVGQRVVVRVDGEFSSVQVVSSMPKIRACGPGSCAQTCQAVAGVRDDFAVLVEDGAKSLPRGVGV